MSYELLLRCVDLHTPHPLSRGELCIVSFAPLERGAIAALLDVSVIGCAVRRCCLWLHLGIVKIVRKCGERNKKSRASQRGFRTFKNLYEESYTY